MNNPMVYVQAKLNKYCAKNANSRIYNGWYRVNPLVRSHVSQKYFGQKVLLLYLSL